MIRKLRVLLKPGAVIPLSLFLILLLFAGIYAITQETDDEDAFDEDALANSDLLADMYFDDDEIDEELPPQWTPPGPPRWFRSNAGGMALEENPSRLAALRNKYALVIDYISPEELEPFLESFYRDDYTVEIHVLYEEGEESRRQWLFRDEAGNTRLNAVRRLRSETEDEPEHDDGDGIIEIEDEIIIEGNNEIAGFIEIFDENALLTDDYWFPEDGGELLTSYFYNGSALLRTELRRKDPGDSDYRKIHTDEYRYNRSLSLRHVERTYHEAAGLEPVRLVFPSRVLDAASDNNFMKDKLSLGSEFLGNLFVGENFRMVFDTDPRGRILSQTLFDGRNEVVWVIKNSWVGDRISSTVKIEGSDEKLTEYEYDEAAKRIVQREIHNGVLERQIFTDGDKETEELFMNGIVVLRAYWENGRKISEERVRR